MLHTGDEEERHLYFYLQLLRGQDLQKFSSVVFSAVDHLQIVSLVVNELGQRKLHGFQVETENWIVLC